MTVIDLLATLTRRAAGFATSTCTTRRLFRTDIATMVGLDVLFAPRARRPRQVADGVERYGRGGLRLVGPLVLSAHAGPSLATLAGSSNTSFDLMGLLHPHTQENGESNLVTRASCILVADTRPDRRVPAWRSP
jgi:hypothetical protein